MKWSQSKSCIHRITWFSKLNKNFVNNGPRQIKCANKSIDNIEKEIRFERPKNCESTNQNLQSRQFFAQIKRFLRTATYPPSMLVYWFLILKRFAMAIIASLTARTFPWQRLRFHLWYYRICSKATTTTAESFILCFFDTHRGNELKRQTPWQIVHKIINKEIPAHIVEDDRYLCSLTRFAATGTYDCPKCCYYLRIWRRLSKRSVCTYSKIARAVQASNPDIKEPNIGNNGSWPTKRFSTITYLNSTLYKRRWLYLKWEPNN